MSLSVTLSLSPLLSLSFDVSLGLGSRLLGWCTSSLSERRVWGLSATERTVDTESKGPGGAVGERKGGGSGAPVRRVRNVPVHSRTDGVGRITGVGGGRADPGVRALVSITLDNSLDSQPLSEPLGTGSATFDERRC